MNDLRELSLLVGLDLRLEQRLAGGEQGSADLVTDQSVRRLVVKRQAEPTKAKRMLEAEPLVRYATDRGWPAARWLHVTRLADGTAVVVQEHLDGRPVVELDLPMMAAILAANDTQTGLAHPSAFDDSAQLAAVVVRHPWRTAVEDRSPVGAGLVRRGAALLARIGRPRLPTNDLVHGDYSSSNLLLTDRGIAFVDCETVGRGTRVRDLADLYRQCYVYPGAPAAALELLRDHAVAIAGPDVFTACVVVVTYNNLAWWAEHRSAADFDVACRRAGTLFEACEPLCR